MHMIIEFEVDYRLHIRICELNKQSKKKELKTQLHIQDAQRQYADVPPIDSSFTRCFLFPPSSNEHASAYFTYRYLIR